LQDWERIYNQVRPHRALDNLSPAEYIRTHHPSVAQQSNAAFLTDSGFTNNLPPKSIPYESSHIMVNQREQVGTCICSHREQVFTGGHNLKKGPSLEERKESEVPPIN